MSVTGDVLVRLSPVHVVLDACPLELPRDPEDGPRSSMKKRQQIIDREDGSSSNRVNSLSIS